MKIAVRSWDTILKAAIIHLLLSLYIHDKSLFSAIFTDICVMLHS